MPPKTAKVTAPGTGRVKIPDKLTDSEKKKVCWCASISIRWLFYDIILESFFSKLLQLDFHVDEFISSCVRTKFMFPLPIFLFLPKHSSSKIMQPRQIQQKLLKRKKRMTQSALVERNRVVRRLSTKHGLTIGMYFFKVICPNTSPFCLCCMHNKT